MMRTYLDVPFKEKDEAKSFGARWDAKKKRWYFTGAKNELLSRWLDASPKQTPLMTLDDLSDEQREMIERAKNGENILVDACIGSGKTTAIQVLCNELPDKSILYLTYNTLLKLDAREKIRQPNVVVTNYHGFAYMVLRKKKVAVGTSDLIQTFNSLKPPLGKRFDLLVLDEYQDIEQEIAEMLLHIKKRNPKMQIIAVGDMKQKIYDKTTLDVPSFITGFLGDYTALNFTKCFRLSKELAARLGNIWEKNINGVNDNCRVEYMSMNEAVNFIAAQNPADILCLGARTGSLSSALNKLESNYGYKFNKRTVYASITDEDRSSVSPRADTAIFTTYDSSKGLERKICVVFDFTLEYWIMRSNFPDTKYEILRNIFCVAASRGKERIIFVKNSGGTILEDKVLATPTSTKMEFGDFLMSEMFAFKYKEDVEDCYRMLNINDVSTSPLSVIDIKTADELIDLSPCVGIYQEAAYFKNYDINSQLEFMKSFHRKLGKILNIKEGDTVDKKILALAAYETGYERYVKQVTSPFVTKEQSKELFERLGEVFSSDERVQTDCNISFKPLRGGVPITYKSEDGVEKPVVLNLRGRADVIKDNVVYELKYVSELQHEHFLQLACYLLAMQKIRGVLWNVRNNQMYEITILDRKKFFSAVIRAITKGVYTEFTVESMTSTA